MWCCVSRAVAGADQGPPYDQCSSKVQPAVEESEKLLQVEHCSDPDVPSVLLPCAICARTFMPQSLEKHARICEQSAGKKRKPFDSAKQRIQGTELAEFVPRQRRRHCQDDRTSKPKSAWKQTHDDLLRAVRAARNEIAEPTMQKQCNSMATPSAPTRANEQGMCPTCNRHFGVKAFDRHVAWCKERIARVTVSPATNIAKERLEARMKYRAPALKNRRQATRDKYSPGSAVALSSANKTSPNLPSSRAKESSSAPSCHKTNDSPVKQKPAVARRPGQTKESSPLGRMKSRPIDRTNSGKDYDPFLLAEQQMNDLLSDTSEQSVTDGPPRVEQNRDSLLPLSHSSAFVKYPYSAPEKRSSLIAPPNEFDDPTTDFSSDSTETNSLSREVFLKDSNELEEPVPGSGAGKASPVRELGRRVIIDRSRALGGGVADDAGRGARSFVGSTERARKILDKVSPKVVRPAVNRSLSVRASSAPKAAVDRNAVNSSDPRDPKKSCRRYEPRGSPCASLNGRNNSYGHLSSSNLSLSSIVSSDVDIKRSNSVFDELMASYEDGDAPFPSLKSLLKHDSLSTSSPVQGRQRNNQASDEELSSPETYKRQDRGKLSADSAYSSLNRKYSNHGRSANDVAGRLEEDAPRSNRRDGDVARTANKCKMSKFCHECGSKFPETAKFCCECGFKRLVL